MRRIIILLLFTGLLACNENKQATPDEEPVSENADTTDRMFSRDDVVREQDAVDTEDPQTIATPAGEIVEGQYVLVDAENGDCSRIEVDLDSPTELCIAEDKIFIRARYERDGEGIVNVFFEEPADTNNAERELPWEEFDRDTPIATLDLQPNQTLVLDWIGFSIDGEVATDYTVYGKKTLEGTYERVE